MSSYRKKLGKNMFVSVALQWQNTEFKELVAELPLTITLPRMVLSHLNNNVLKIKWYSEHGPETRHWHHVFICQNSSNLYFSLMFDFPCSVPTTPFFFSSSKLVLLSISGNATDKTRQQPTYSMTPNLIRHTQFVVSESSK